MRTSHEDKRKVNIADGMEEPERWLPAYRTVACTQINDLKLGRRPANGKSVPSRCETVRFLACVGSGWSALIDDGLQSQARRVS